MPDAPAAAHGYERLDRVLHALRMRSTFYCNASLGQPWGLEMPAVADSVSFHVVTTGSCWLRLSGAAILELRAGDFVLIPHGRGHELLSGPDGEAGPRVDMLPQRYLTEHYSQLSYGGAGRHTRLICGVVAFDTPRRANSCERFPRRYSSAATVSRRFRRFETFSD